MVSTMFFEDSLHASEILQPQQMQAFRGAYRDFLHLLHDVLIHEGVRDEASESGYAGAGEKCTAPL